MNNQDRYEMTIKLVRKGILAQWGLETGNPDPEEAIRWYTRAALLGSPMAMNRLGRIYLERRDMENAYYWFLEAAMKGEADSLYQIGEMYYRGIHVRQDGEKARRFLEEAYRRGAKDACAFMGLYAENEDLKKAVDYYREGLTRGNAGSAVNLARCYSEGKGVPRDPDKARSYALLACRWGSAEACEDLGRMYETGNGGEPDLEKAMMYYTEGAQRGSEDCGAALERLKEKGAR